MSKKIFIFGLILISFLYLFFRLYQLDNLIGFRLDQGVHLAEAKSIFDEKKISLIGPVASKSFMGHDFFVGANYYYVLGVIGLISHWDPLVITIYFIFLELFFYLFFVYFLKRKFSSFWALVVFIFIALSSYLVIHSRFFWNPHLLIPLSILFLLFSEKYFFKKQAKYLFLIAFFWGFAFACHYSAIFWILFFLYIFVKAGKLLDLKSYLIVIAGFILGNLPFFIFEIRHNFYNIKTIFYVFSHSLQSKELTSHYFIFPLLIFFIFTLLFLLSLIKRKFIGNSVLIIVVALSLLIQNNLFKNYSPLDNLPFWSYQEQKKVVELIIKDGCPQNFNIAATFQGDTRFYDLRYLLSLKKCNPMSVEAYPQAQKLFLVAPYSRSVDLETVWEVSSFRPFEIREEIPLNDQITFFELDKITE